jgi:hypothetical protein
MTVNFKVILFHQFIYKDKLFQVESISGRPYRRWMKEHCFDPWSRNNLVKNNFLLNLCSRTFGTAATIVPAPDDRWWWLWRNWWNENWQGKPKYSAKTCPSATLSTTNPTRLDPGLNPGRRGGKPATKRLILVLDPEQNKIPCFALCEV